MEAWGNVNDCLVATNSYTDRGVLMPLLNGLMSVKGIIPIGDGWRLIVLHLKINLTSTIDRLRLVSCRANLLNFSPVVNHVALVMLPLHTAMEYLSNNDRASISLCDVLYARGEIGIGLERLYHLMQIVDKLENVALSTTLYSRYAFYKPAHKVENVKYV